MLWIVFWVLEFLLSCLRAPDTLWTDTFIVRRTDL
jgi:hypothetical protein